MHAAKCTSLLLLTKMMQTIVDSKSLFIMSDGMLAAADADDAAADAGDADTVT